MESWWIDTDNVVQLAGLRDVVTNEYVNDATVTASLTDDNGSVVEGAQSLPLVYQNGSDGNYVGHVPHTVSLEAGRQYTLTITATGAGFQLVTKITRRAAFKGP